MKQIKLTKGQFALVDDADFEKLNQFKWHAQWSPDTKSFYAYRTDIEGIKEFIHRKIMNFPEGMQIDHINHDTLNNTRENLRAVTISQNQMNKRTYSNNTSGCKGVSWCKWAKKWKMSISVNKKTINKYFTDFFEAVCARKSAENKHYGEYAYKE